MIKEVVDIESTSKLLNFFNQNVGNGTNPFLKYIGYYKNNELVGVCVYELIYDRIEIDYIIVDSKERRKNIGSKLLEYIINLGNYSISLEVRKDNVAAINLYKKYGFEIVCERKNYYKDIDGLLMIRR